MKMPAEKYKDCSDITEIIFSKQEKKKHLAIKRP